MKDVLTFRNDPLYSIVLPPVELRRVGLFNRFLSTVQNREGCLVQIAMDEEGEQKDCVRGVQKPSHSLTSSGVAVWRLPGAQLSWTQSVSQKLALTKAFGVGAKTYDYFTIQETISNFISDFIKENGLSESCWMLDVLGVDPVSSFLLFMNNH